jgi:3-dehydroquinate dehydratase-2
MVKYLHTSRHFFKTLARMKILALQGINLNMSGRPDLAQYSSTTLAEIVASVLALGKWLGAQVEASQANSQYAMAEGIPPAHTDGADAVGINAGAWADNGKLDTLDILKCLIMDVRMSNIHARAAFWHLSVLTEFAKGQIYSFGIDSYLLGLRAAVSSFKAVKT